MTAFLEICQLTKKFGGLIAVNDVSFTVKEHEILSIIGPNGAGKSTLFKLIASFLSPNSGEIIFQGKKISNRAPHLVAAMGVVRSFQETTIFKDMSVLDNIVVAHHLQSRANLLGFFFHSRQARQDEKNFAQSSKEILTLLGLDHVAGQIAKNLPHGYLRALGMGIGLAARPKILLLDEPFAGMNHEETKQAVDRVRRIRDRGVTVLLVEHDMQAVMQISDRIVVLNFGVLIATGKPFEIRNNEEVITAYLGREDDQIGF